MLNVKTHLIIMAFIFSFQCIAQNDVIPANDSYVQPIFCECIMDEFIFRKNYSFGRISHFRKRNNV